jgi:hypothetical protein
MGVIKAASVIDVNWVKHLIPMLKDPIDPKRLSGIEPVKQPSIKTSDRRQDL